VPGGHRGLEDFMRRRVKSDVLLLFAFAILSCLLLSVGNAGATDCEGTVTANKRAVEEDREFDRHIFVVEVTSDADCARVGYDLIVEERLSSGETRTKTVSKSKKASRGESKAQKVPYKVDKSTTMLSWKFEVTSCKVCGSPD
jgi:hypothetical protein